MSWANIASAVHWAIVLQAGLVTGVFAVLISFTLLWRLYLHEWGNALLVNCPTAMSDAYSHPGHVHPALDEHPAIGVVSAFLALAASYLFERLSGRVLTLWPRRF
jgi:hypothetical protein